MCVFFVIFFRLKIHIGEEAGGLQHFSRSRGGGVLKESVAHIETEKADCCREEGGKRGRGGGGLCVLKY